MPSDPGEIDWDAILAGVHYAPCLPANHRLVKDSVIPGMPVLCTKCRWRWGSVTECRDGRRGVPERDD